MIRDPASFQILLDTISRLVREKLHYVDPDSVDFAQ